MTRQQHVHSEHIGSESTADLKATRKGDNSSVLGFVWITHKEKKKKDNWKMIGVKNAAEIGN